MLNITYKRYISLRGYSKRRKVRDILVIENNSFNTIQVGIRIDGYLLDLLVLKSKERRNYNLRYPAIPISSTINVEEITEDVDMLLEENSRYRKFESFKT